MIFSVSHHSGHIKEAEEIRCPYNQLGLIFDFIKENPEKRYNIIINGDTTQQETNKLIEQVEYVKEVAKDYTIECGNLMLLKDLLKRGYNTYLRFPVSDWETFTDLSNLGVTDIYIDGPLGFDTTALKKRRKDIKIRVSPTISPNSSITGMESNSFFIRPEDLHLYEDIIDIIDFHESDIDKGDVLFQIYKRGSFIYNINDLIAGLPRVNNLFIKDDFAKTRLTCKQKCHVPGYRCKFCPSYFYVIENSIKLAEKSN